MRINTFALISAYNNDLSWIPEVFENYVIYNQGEPKVGTVQRSHLGADLLDKFSWIVENYDNLPETVMFIKANLFNYITKEEFDAICHNKTFTPLLTQNHRVYEPVCRYENGIYLERNDSWYANHYPHKFFTDYNSFAREMGLPELEYIPFAPGANYIVPRENILKHPKAFYQKLIGYLDYTSYSTEAQMCERALYSIWSNPTSDE